MKWYYNKVRFGNIFWWVQSTWAKVKWQDLNTYSWYSNVLKLLDTIASVLFCRQFKLKGKWVKVDEIVPVQQQTKAVAQDDTFETIDVIGSIWTTRAADQFGSFIDLNKSKTIIASSYQFWVYCG